MDDFKRSAAARYQDMLAQGKVIAVHSVTNDFIDGIVTTYLRSRCTCS